MLRLAVLGVALLGLVVGGIIAGEYKGKIKSIDTDAKKVTLETKDGDKTFKYTGESKIVGGKGDMTFDKMAEYMAKAKEKSKDAPEGGKGKGGRGGLGVTVITNGEGDKETITEVKMAARAKKKDSN
ncbi:MAG: hypothetical protein DWH88_03950 [Planctomycetota bacterium]|jgi:hypothetical protein|nr:MAG: hypothetical protein DWH88_03950 [Planctomycetota bacterium]